MAKQKVELLNTLPSDPLKREALRKAVEEAVKAKVRIDDEKSFIKDVVQNLKDEGYDPKFVRTLIKAEYKAGKERERLEEQLEQVTEAEILFGRTASGEVICQNCGMIHCTCNEPAEDADTDKDDGLFERFGKKVDEFLD